MNRRSSRRARLLALLLPLLLVAAACGNSDDDDDASTDTEAPATTEAATETTSAAEDGATGTTAPDGDGGESDDERDTFVAIEGVPGVSDEEIGFAIIGTRSNNPLGTCILDCYVEGVQAYFDWRNEEGGIFGRELVVADTLDDELARNLERSQDVAASDSYFGAFVATLVAAGFGTLDDAGVPTFVWNIHATEFANRENIWGHMAAACANCSNRFIPFLAREAGVTTAAVLGYGVSENSKVCAQAYADSIEQYSDDLGGITVGYFNNDLGFGLPNGIGPEVTAMKDAGIEFIATCMDLNGMKTLAQELQRQGMDDVIMYHPNTYNQAFVAESAELFEGDFIVPQFVPFEYETGLEQQEKFREYMEASGAELSELAMIGWINADQAFQGLLAAGPEFSREAVIAARNSVTEDTAGGLINPIDWTRQHVPPTEGDPTNDYAQECISVVRVEGGVFVPFNEDSTKPWLCWPNDTLDWSEPVETAFE